jgi:DNA-binding LacI/PurR family transcriptional regulator
MATIREISKETGLSIATVSKVLNGQSGTSSDAKKRILAVAKKLNYRPNLNARHLKTGTSRTLGIIAEDITVFNTPEIVDGIGVCCEDHNYHYILGNLRFNKRFGHAPHFDAQKTELVLDMINEMMSKQVDGIVYVGCHSHNIAHLSAQAETKFVCAYCFSENPDIPSVFYNDREAAYKVAELLLSAGHRKIGIIAGLKDSISTTDRLLGFQEALFDHGIPYNPHIIHYGEWDRDHGFEIAPRLIAEGVTAIFAHNDLIAMGVYDYCNQNGIEIGKDLSLIGFDNREVSSVCRPALTTVSLPLFNIGHIAADVMFNILENAAMPERHEILLSCDIVERESTGKREIAAAK